MAQRERRTYSPEQKADAVRLVRQTGSVSKVAKDLDLTETSLRNWLKQAEVDGPRGSPEVPTLLAKIAASTIATKMSKSLSRCFITPPVRTIERSSEPNCRNRMVGQLFRRLEVLIVHGSTSGRSLASERHGHLWPSSEKYPHCGAGPATRVPRFAREPGFRGRSPSAARHACKTESTWVPGQGWRRMA
jgi:transposase-like protein